MTRKHVLIVGAGAGGLTAAAHLAGRGLDVTVVEKNEQAGGRCGRLRRDGHHFDIGPTLFVMPRLYEQEFAALGERLGDHLALQRVDPTYHLIFDDGRRLELTADRARMQQQLEAIEPGSHAALGRYLEEGRRHYDLAMPNLVRRNFRSLGEFLSPAMIPLYLRLKAVTPHYAHMRRYFDDPRLRAAFTFQDMYMGLSPFVAPATFSLMQYTELADGVWYPMGGMAAVAGSLRTLAERRGAQLILGTSVDRILTHNSHVAGVCLEDGRVLEADAIIANADLPYVYRELLPADGAANRLGRLRYSCSTINFLWGLDRAYPQIPPHALFLVDAYRENFEAIQNGATLAEQPSVYFHAPARLDPAMAPPGQDTLIGIVPVGHIKEAADQDWEGLRERARNVLLAKLTVLGAGDLEAHIKFEIALTPPFWRSRFNLVRGATHGLAHTLLQMGYFRPRNRHARYRNLYFAGASTHPGTGLPTALVSGRLAAERVLEDSGLAV
jgi:phytoene desaturase